LPSRALYDALGSALFDAICELPWYPLTRAERRLLHVHRDAIFRSASLPSRVVELGPGNGSKLDLLLGQPTGAEHVRRLGVGVA
jgi:L-histidine N-alpha-methyltransferase